MDHCYATHASTTFGLGQRLVKFPTRAHLDIMRVSSLALETIGPIEGWLSNI